MLFKKITTLALLVFLSLSSIVKAIWTIEQITNHSDKTAYLLIPEPNAPTDKVSVMKATYGIRGKSTTKNFVAPLNEGDAFIIILPDGGASYDIAKGKMNIAISDDALTSSTL